MSSTPNFIFGYYLGLVIVSLCGMSRLYLEKNIEWKNEKIKFSTTDLNTTPITHHHVMLLRVISSICL